MRSAASIAGVVLLALALTSHARVLTTTEDEAVQPSGANGGELHQSNTKATPGLPVDVPAAGLSADLSSEVEPAARRPPSRPRTTRTVEKEDMSGLLAGWPTAEQLAAKSSDVEVAAASTTGGVVWEGNWAFGCDFPGNDIKSIQGMSDGAKCGPACGKLRECSAFTWNPSAGTCYLKRGNLRKANAVRITDQRVVCGVAPGAVLNDGIRFGNGLPWGEWTGRDLCPRMRYATSLDGKVEKSQGGRDDTALNGISLGCRMYGIEDVNYGTVEASGEFGTWTGISHCPYARETPESSLIIGMNQAAEPMQGDKDDTAVNNMAALCADSGSRILTVVDATTWGIWVGGTNHWSPNGAASGMKRCPEGTAVCGLDQRIESHFFWGIGDDTSLTDVRMYCCTLP